MAEPLTILFEDNHVLGVIKPCNVPVMPDASKDKSFLDIIKDDLKARYQKPGNVYLGLVHRLDRPVGGVMLFAKTSKAASRLSTSIQKYESQKTYLAIIDAIGLPSQGLLEDYLIKDEKTNTVYVTSKEKGKLARLHYRLLQENKHHSLVEIELETGRPHQIRVQFSSRKWPLLNDQRYHPHPKKGQIALWSYRFSIPHPTTKEIITITAKPTTSVFAEFNL